jgi:hypothetical protein
MLGLPRAINSELPPVKKLRLFASIPPERMGLNGEYDHDGLAKRVSLALEQRFSIDDLRALNVSQRGGVVVFYGWVSSRAMLEQMEAIAQSVHGATDVETVGVNLRQFEHAIASEQMPCGA